MCQKSKMHKENETEKVSSYSKLIKHSLNKRCNYRDEVELMGNIAK